MNLTNLFKMQKDLDQKIIQKHGLKNMDRLPYLILALQVELGECANEWRGFKFWSENNSPKPPKHNWRVSEDGLNKEWIPDWGYESYPLLEEYVDCLHFVLSIGIHHGFDKEVAGLSIEDVYVGDITEQFSELMRADWHKCVIGDGDYYHRGLEMFLSLGEMLGFTWGEIEQAYLQKNEINHKRQEKGY
ncbi:hypothetical protein CHH61_04115 [Shouchella clausii]|uniref:dUTPase n=1 Tax=Shouchella clausii TaxID=79880 RepID=A0A268S6L7_SHOCL|nr:dUTP diphosphatase [Shouchella clausii]PAF27321.1 hypothetical protein CHH61_04115 [Shouchella clausii]